MGATQAGGGLVNDPILLSAKRSENAYLHSLVTRQAQTIDELLDLADQLVAAMQDRRLS